MRLSRIRIQTAGSSDTEPRWRRWPHFGQSKVFWGFSVRPPGRTAGGPCRRRQSDPPWSSSPQQHRRNDRYIYGSTAKVAPRPEQLMASSAFITRCPASSNLIPSINKTATCWLSWRAPQMDASSLGSDSLVVVQNNCDRVERNIETIWRNLECKLHYSIYIESTRLWIKCYPC